MAEIITWEQLKNSATKPLPGGDRIEVIESKLEEPYFEMQLSIAPEITLWKTVTLTGGEIINNVAKFWIARIELIDDFSGPVSFRAESRMLGGTTLLLGKGLWTGARQTAFYHILEYPYHNVRAELKWIAD